MNARRLQHDLYWGCRLNLLRCKHCAGGFRGKKKGQGFRAYLMAEKIPVRLAYRLIRRYRLVEQTMRWAEAKNIDLQNEIFRPEDLAAILEGFKRMSDEASVTNGVGVAQ
jgi:hypothetical protein